MSTQQRMKATLQRAGIPAKEIQVFGSQILVTCWSRDAAEKWASLLARFATLRGIVESVDYAKQNTKTVLCPSTVQVWRVGAFIP